MRDVSIEYAHIYTNKSVSKEHELSIDLLRNLKSELSKKHQSFCLMVLVDDYSFPDPTFDYDVFIRWLTNKGFAPDLVLRESQLIPVCDKVLKEVRDEDLKAQLVDYIKAKKYPCSLFIAAWYLLRLGHLAYGSFPNGLCAKKIVNILPESFKPFEDKALEIIASTRFASARKVIEYRYIAGRLIA